MAFVQFEDLYGTVELVVFPKTFDAVQELLRGDEPLLVKGRIHFDQRDDTSDSETKPVAKVSVDEVVLVRSRTLPGGAVHDVLERFQLAA